MTARETLPPISSRRLAVFRWYARRLVARHFSAIRVMRDAMPPEAERPTVFYANHASWWDPLVMLLVMHAAYPGITVYAPIDAAALARYPSLAKLGFFGVERDSLIGARRALRDCRAVLAQPDTMLALTPQGCFADVRERPIVLKRGLAELLKHAPSAVAVPVAVEYPFWNEMRPEVLIRFGEAIAGAAGSRDTLTEELAARLEHELDALAACSCRRAPADFVTLLDGGTGIGFMQDMPSRLRAWRDGSRFDASHRAVRRSGTVPGRQ